MDTVTKIVLTSTRDLKIKDFYHFISKEPDSLYSVSTHTPDNKTLVRFKCNYWRLWRQEKG